MDTITERGRQTPRQGVLYISTGSPDQPTKEAVRGYLEAYLTDRRLVDIPKAKWYPILYGIILPRRSPRTAGRYETIWTEHGSPLTYYVERQRAGISETLAEDGYSDIPVVIANRYTKPSIEEGIRRLVEDHGVNRIVIITVYPHYASVTNGTMFQQVYESLAKLKRIPDLAAITSYCDDPLYLDALAARIRASWSYESDGRHFLIFTYHSTLCADIDAGDVYLDQATLTGREVARRLGIAESDWAVGFQSVFDKGRSWLGPLTETELIPELAKRGITDLAVCAPGFTAECLETHYDIDVDQRKAFESLVPEGTFTYVPCLNDEPDFVRALGKIVERHLLR